MASKPMILAGDQQMFLVSLIRPFLGQPRTDTFDDSEIRGLARRIKRDGQLKPITLKPLKGDKKYQWELIDGERRLRAHVAGGLERIWGVVKNVPLSNDSQFLLSVQHNMDQKEHSHTEVIAIIKRLRKTMSVKEIAEKIGKSAGWVYIYDEVGKNLSPELLKEMHVGVPSATRLRLDQARALTSIPPEKQMRVFKSALKVPLKRRTRHIREHVEEITGKVQNVRPDRQKNRMLRFVENLIGEIEVINDMHGETFKLTLNSLSNPQRRKMNENLLKLRDELSILIRTVGRPL